MQSLTKMLTYRHADTTNSKATICTCNIAKNLENRPWIMAWMIALLQAKGIKLYVDSTWSRKRWMCKYLALNIMEEFFFVPPSWYHNILQCSEKISQYIAIPFLHIVTPITYMYIYIYNCTKIHRNGSEDQAHCRVTILWTDRSLLWVTGIFHTHDHYRHKTHSHTCDTCIYM